MFCSGAFIHLVHVSVDRLLFWTTPVCECGEHYLVLLVVAVVLVRYL